jgi:hypothetical protein
MIFSPIAAPAIVHGYGLSNATLGAFPLVGAVVFGCLALTLSAAYFAEPITVSPAASRLAKLLLANFIFVLFDVTIFVILVYGRHYAGDRCQPDSSCDLYPVGWLALAGMHLCYATLGCFIRFRWSKQKH